MAAKSEKTLEEILSAFEESLNESDIGEWIKKRKGLLDGIEAANATIFESQAKLNMVNRWLGKELGMSPSKGGKSSGGGGTKGTRGEGWEAVKAALEANGGKAKAVDLKDAYAKLGRPTPLSVALASYVAGGKLKKKGKGRDAEFSIAS